MAKNGLPIQETNKNINKIEMISNYKSGDVKSFLTISEKDKIRRTELSYKYFQNKIQNLQNKISKFKINIK